MTFPKNISPPVDTSTWDQQNNSYVKEEQKRKHKEFEEKLRPAPAPKLRQYCFHCLEILEKIPDSNPKFPEYKCTKCDEKYICESSKIDLVALNDRSARAFYCEWDIIRDEKWNRDRRRKQALILKNWLAKDGQVFDSDTEQLISKLKLI